MHSTMTLETAYIIRQFHKPISHTKHHT